MKTGAPTAILDHEVILRMGATSRGEWSRKKEPGSLRTLETCSTSPGLPASGLIFCQIITSYTFKPLLF